MKRLLASLLAVLALAMPQARADFRGKVYMLLNPEAPRAEWRRIPLPGAYIFVFWDVTVPAPAHAITTCRYNELARSDEKGEYVMEGPNFVTAGLAHTWFLVYSPGLQRITYPYEGSLSSATDITMAKSKDAPGERLSRISGFIDPECPDMKLTDPRGLLPEYHRSVLDEAKSLHVDTPRGLSDMRSIEAAVRRSSGLDKRGPVRAVIKPASGSIQSSPPLPERRP